MVAQCRPTSPNWNTYVWPKWVLPGEKLNQLTRIQLLHGLLQMPLLIKPNWQLCVKHWRPNSNQSLIWQQCMHVCKNWERLFMTISQENSKSLIRIVVMNNQLMPLMTLYGRDCLFRPWWMVWAQRSEQFLSGTVWRQSARLNDVKKNTAHMLRLLFKMKRTNKWRNSKQQLKSFKWLNLSTVLHLPEAEVETVDEGEVRPFPMTTERKLILAGNVIKWATLLETA